MPKCKGCSASLPNIKTYSASLPFYESRPDGPQRTATEPLFSAGKNLARLLRDAALPTTTARDPMCVECLTTIVQALGIKEEYNKSEVTSTRSAARYYAQQLEVLGPDAGSPGSEGGDGFGEEQSEDEELAECLRLEVQIAENESRLALLEEEDSDFADMKLRGAAQIELLQFVSKEATASVKNHHQQLRNEVARFNQIEGCLGVAFSFSQRRVDSDKNQLSMGMVNDLVLGSMAALPVESAEINAALGLVALWFCSMGVRTRTDFNPYSFLPLGSRASIRLSIPTSREETAPIPPQNLPLYFPSTEDYDAANMAMKALLRCLKYLGQRVQEIGAMRLCYGGKVVCVDHLRGRCKRMMCKDVHPPLEVEVGGQKRQVCTGELLRRGMVAHGEGCKCEKFHPKINPTVVERREYTQEQREAKAGYTQGMPHSIQLGEERDLIGDRPIKRPAAQSEQWSEAMVFFFQNCDYLQRCMILQELRA